MFSEIYFMNFGKYILKIFQKKINKSLKKGKTIISL